MTPFKNVTIMMGAVNETDSLRETVSEILRLCNHEDLREILIMCAQHITPECMSVVDEVSAFDTDVEIIPFTQKGKGIAALTEMIDMARGSHSLIVASDGALDLECVPLMIEKIKQGEVDIVSTSRWLKGCRFIGYGKTRHFFNFLGRIFLTVLFGPKKTDFTNANQIVPTEIYQSINWESKGYPILMELVLKPMRLGFKFAEIPSNCYSRKQGKSGNSFMQTARYFSTALHIRFMKKSDILKKDSHF